MNSTILVNWLRAMVQAMPHGGKAEAAKMLGITPSGLSKILSNPDRGFDAKTCNALAWSQNSKADRWPESRYPVLSRVTVGPIIIEMRKGEQGNEFPVWLPAVKVPVKK
jgi:hypothetical protein